MTPEEKSLEQRQAEATRAGAADPANQVPARARTLHEALAMLGHAMGAAAPSPPTPEPSAERAASQTVTPDPLVEPVSVAAAAVPPHAAATEAGQWSEAPKGMLGNVLGRVIEKLQWVRGKVFNPKVFLADVKTPDRLVRPPRHWDHRIKKWYRAHRSDGDPFFATFESWVNFIYQVAGDGRGYVQRSWEAMAAAMGMCRETARKCVRIAEDGGWLGTFNTLYRDPETNDLKRDSNVYILFTEQDAAAIRAVEDQSARAVKRECLTLSRGAMLWGLLVRPWGLNATPSPSNRHRTRSRPSPA